MKSTSFVMNFVMLAIFITLVFIASHYPPQARFMPFVVGIPAIALCVLQIVLDIRAARRKTVGNEDARGDVARAQDEVSRYAGRAIESDASAADVPAVDNSAGVPPNMVRREIILWAYFLSFVIGILLFGFWMSIPVFLTVFLRNEAGMTWLRAALTGAVAATILWFVVVKGLKVDLHEGFVVTYLLDQLGI